MLAFPRGDAILALSCCPPPWCSPGPRSPYGFMHSRQRILGNVMPVARLALALLASRGSHLCPSAPQQPHSASARESWRNRHWPLPRIPLKKAPKNEALPWNPYKLPRSLNYIHQDWPRRLAGGPYPAAMLHPSQGLSKAMRTRDTKSLSQPQALKLRKNSKSLCPTRPEPLRR